MLIKWNSAISLGRTLSLDLEGHKLMRIRFEFPFLSAELCELFSVADAGVEDGWKEKQIEATFKPSILVKQQPYQRF